MPLKFCPGAPTPTRPGPQPLAMLCGMPRFECAEGGRKGRRGGARSWIREKLLRLSGENWCAQPGMHRQPICRLHARDSRNCNPMTPGSHPGGPQSGMARCVVEGSPPRPIRAPRGQGTLGSRRTVISRPRTHRWGHPGRALWLQVRSWRSTLPGGDV